MRLGTLKDPKKLDGRLVIVSKDGKRALEVPEISENLLEALQNWREVGPKLEAKAQELDAQADLGSPLEPSQFHSPLPRTFQWLDGSAFLQHVKLVRQARNAPIPESLETTPLMYQGAGDTFLAPTEDIPQIDFSHGTDFEGEVGVILDEVPMGVNPEDALGFIRLFVIINDVSLRGLIPEEIKAGFGFLQGKPSSAFAPFALSPDELGDAWKEGRVHLPLTVKYNGEVFGTAEGGEMHFHFGQLISHAARTRRLSAGTILGSGTISNEDPSRGSSCLVERRMIEKIEEGVIKTPFMKVGDQISMEMFSNSGRSLFGAIDQKVIAQS